MKKRTRKKVIGALSGIKANWLTHGAIQKQKPSKKRNAADDLKLNLKEDPMSIQDRLQAVEELIGEAELISEAISPEEREQYKLYSRELKKKLKKDWKITARVKLSASKRPDPFISASVTSGKIPNELRAKALDVIGGRATNMDDINYGNIRSDHITLHYSQWLKITGPLASTSKPSRPRRETAAPSGEELFAHLKDIVDKHQHKMIPGVGDVDAFTANAIVNVANALSPVNRKKFLAMPIRQMQSTALRLIK